MKKTYLLVAAIILGFVVNAQIPTNGLVAHYNFDGNPNDHSGNNFHLSASGAYTYEHMGNANPQDSAFVGNTVSSNWYSLSNFYSNNTMIEVQNFTFSMWARLTSLPSVYSSPHFIGFGDGNNTHVFFRLNNHEWNGTVRLQGGYQSSTGGNSHITESNYFNSTNVLNSWHMFTMTSEVTGGIRTTKLFMDYQLLASDTVTIQSEIQYNSTSPCFRVGRSANGDANNILRAKINDVYYYNRALNIDEIGELYQQYGTICNITVPDANFKNYLLNNPLINGNGDAEIQCGEAASFSGNIDCSDLNINDLTGIELFTNLRGLNCSNNSITNLNIRQLRYLVNINCTNNQLTDLDLTNTGIDLYGNKHIDCSYNQLTSIITPIQMYADYFNYSNNQIATGFATGGSPVSIDTLICDNNGLTTNPLGLSVNNVSYLSCQNNQLTQLDFSGSLGSSLKKMFCQSNQLTVLNLANGENANIVAINTTNNAQLDCIQVDDAIYSVSNWTGADFQFDSGVGFNENCATAGIGEINENIKYVYPNPADKLLNIETTESEGVEIMDILGKEIFSVELKAGNNTIDINQLTAGVYFIKSVNGSTIKFVKE